MSNSGFKEDTAIYGISVLIERAISFLMLPVLTKNLTLELYGVWSQIIVTIGLLMPIVLMGFQTALVNYYSGSIQETAGEKNAIFHGMLIITLGNSVFVLCLCTFFASFVSFLMFGDKGYSQFAGLFGLLFLTEVLFELLVAYLRSDLRIRRLSLYYIMKSTGRIGVITAALVFFNKPLFAALTWLLIIQMLFILFIYISDILWKRSFGLNLSVRSETWWRIIKFSLPLVPYSFLIWVNNFMNRYLILHMLDITRVSIYAVAYSLASVTSILYSILGFTFYPYMANLWNKEQHPAVSSMMSKGIAYYVFFAAPVVVIMVVLSEPIILILTTRKFLVEPAMIFFLGLAIGMFGFYQLNLYLLLLGGKSLLNLRILILSLLVNSILNLLLIPALDIMGASIAMCLSNSIMGIWSCLAGRTILKYSFPWKTLGRSIAMCIPVATFLAIAKSLYTVFNLLNLATTVCAAIMFYVVMDLLYRDSLLLKLWRTS